MNVHDLAAGTDKRDFDSGERAARREPLPQIAVRRVGHDNRPEALQRLGSEAVGGIVADEGGQTHTPLRPRGWDRPRAC